MDFDTQPDYFTSDTEENVNDKNSNVIQFNPEEREPAKPAVAPVVENPEPPKPPKRHHPFRKFFIWTAVIVVLVLGVVVWARYINPYETDMQERGYVVDFKRQGVLFKTWEGQLLVQSALTDATKPYSRDFVFSVDNEALASRLAGLNGTGKMVLVTYERFWGILPWRGASQCVVTDVREL